MFSLMPWHVFAIIGVLLMIAEIFVSGFVMLPIGLAFLMTAIVAAFVADWIVLISCLAFFLVVMFWVFQKHLKKFHAKTRAYTGAEGMVGVEVTVTEDIGPGKPGYVKLYGDSWQALSLHSKPLKTGDRAVITKIEGNKVIVESIN